MKPVTWLFLDCFNTLLDEADGLTHQSGMEPIADIPVAHGLFGSEEAFLQTYLAWRRSAWSGPEYPEMCLHERLSRLCLLYTSPSPRDKRQSRMPSSA